MILKSMNIKNFRSYYGDNTFEFAQGLTLIIGDNGDGKTTFFEALEWLFDTATENKSATNISEKRKSEMAILMKLLFLWYSTTMVLLRLKRVLVLRNKPKILPAHSITNLSDMRIEALNVCQEMASSYWKRVSILPFANIVCSKVKVNWMFSTITQH